jgi:hypothetical protein
MWHSQEELTQNISIIPTLADFTLGAPSRLFLGADEPYGVCLFTAARHRRKNEAGKHQKKRDANQ